MRHGLFANCVSIVLCRILHLLAGKHKPQEHVETPLTYFDLFLKFSGPWGVEMHQVTVKYSNGPFVKKMTMNFESKSTSLTNVAFFSNGVDSANSHSVLVFFTHQQRSCYWTFNNPPNTNVVIVIPATATKPEEIQH